jgi:hypothetical protein
MANLESTDDVVTDVQLREILGLEDDETLDGACIPVCAGEWRRESEDSWRFWIDPGVSD